MVTWWRDAWTKWWTRVLSLRCVVGWHRWHTTRVQGFEHIKRAVLVSERCTLCSARRTRAQW